MVRSGGEYCVGRGVEGSTVGRCGEGWRGVLCRERSGGEYVGRCGEGWRGVLCRERSGGEYCR